MINIMQTIGDITKWSWGEMTSSANGKTSASLTAGFITIMCGLICVFTCILLKNTELTYASVGVVSIGAGLIGYAKKVSGVIAKIGDNTNDSK